MASIIDSAEVITRLANESNFLAVKLKSGSPNYTHFAQICILYNSKVGYMLQMYVLHNRYVFVNGRMIARNYIV